jgi:hypothetical protein
MVVSDVCLVSVTENQASNMRETVAYNLILGLLCPLPL